MTAAVSLRTTAPPSSAYALLRSTEAAQFYEQACSREGLYVHSTFLKQLLHGSVLIQFENGYLGGSGIAPIVQTLQRIPLRALLLSKCALSSEDVKLLCAGLATHPQLEKIDVRGVDLTIGAVKELLHLAARNPRITEILMDEGLPKFVAIQQQCQRNAQAAAASMSACVMCGAGVSVEARASCETVVLRFVLEHLKPHSNSISGACLTMLCGALQHCIDRNDGILSVCGEACGESLAEDLCRCVWSVPKTLVWKVPFDLPKAQFLRVFLAHMHEQFQRDIVAVETSLPNSMKRSTPAAVHKAATAAAGALKSNMSKAFFTPGPVDAQAEECWRTKKPRSDIDDFFDNRADRDVSQCTVCGQPGVCSTDGATWLLRTLQIDLEEHGVAVTPAAMLRLCRVLAANADVRPCSRRCLRHLVRYALYGYGGVNCSYVGGFPPLSTALGSTQEVLRLPLVDFTVVDVGAEAIHDVASEEINCALTVASAVRDTDGVPMDPYLIFSIGRQLRKMSTRSIGMDLASACEAVRLVGCLPEKDAPFTRAEAWSRDGSGGKREARTPPRDLVADWAAWSASSEQDTVRRWLHSAFAHRRQRVSAIDGPHRDLFDNIRAALWALRHQGRSVLITMKVAMSWLSLKDGVVPTTASAHTHGFCTTAKVIGQVTRSNTIFLVVQCPLGRHIGDSGLLYVPKTVFMQCVRGLAFMFTDAVSLEYREAGWRASFYGKEIVGPALGVPNGDVRQLRRLFVLLASYTQGRKHQEGVAWKVVGSKVPAEPLRNLFSPEHLPAALWFLREALSLTSLTSVAATSAANDVDACGAPGVHGSYWDRILLSSRYSSQLLFYFSEMLGSGDWLRQAVETATSLPLRLSAASTPPPSAVAVDTDVPPTTSAAPRRSEGTGEDSHDWQILSTVPELSSLLYDPVAVSAEAAARAESVSPAKVVRKKGGAKATVLSSNSAPPRAPKPPASQPPAQTSVSSRRRVSSVASAADEAMPLSPSRFAGTSRSPLTGKLAQSTDAPGDVRPTNTATFNAAASPPQDKTQLRLLKAWRAERATRSELLSDATRIGVVQYLRTRTQASRPGAPATTVRTVSLEDLRETGAAVEGFRSASDYGSCNEEVEGVQLHLLGKPWLVVPMQMGEVAEDGTALPPDLHLIFIGNSICVYSLNESRLLCQPALMSADTLTTTFPFASGVDAATLHPTNSDLVFFFSGREWLLFDLSVLECVDGPYPLSMHGQFRKLPAAFHDGIDSAIAIPDSRMLVFFRDYAYVVFDVVARRCVGGVGQLDAPQLLSSSSTEPSGYKSYPTHGSVAGCSTAASSVLSSLPLSKAATAALLGRKGTEEPSHAEKNLLHSAATPVPSTLGRNNHQDDSDEDAEREGGGTLSSLSSTSCPLRIEVELQRRLGIAPLSGFKTRSAVAGSPVAHWLVDRRGGVAAVEWECTEALESDRMTGCRWVLRGRNVPPPLSSETPFARLPLVFRQNSPDVLPVLCALAVTRDFDLGDIYEVAAAGSGTETVAASRLELFDPESGQHSLLAPFSGDVADDDASMTDSPNSAGQRANASPTLAAGTAAFGENGSAAASRDLVDTPAATITSSLVSTSVAQRMPLALSRSGPVMAYVNTNGTSPTRSEWESEVFFYGTDKGDELLATQQNTRDILGKGVISGPLSVPVPQADASEKAAHRRIFIEYDLGILAPRRVFSALLLVLDTSMLPASVLQLAPLMASVECSVEGEVYLSQALIRVTGPITAAKWGASQLMVDCGAARFWRLRFHTAVPAVVGVVRLFWFESPHGLPRRSVHAVPLSLCDALPLTMRVADDEDGDESGEAPVSIEAESVMASPELLLRDENVLPVFVDNPAPHARGWLDHHVAFPLLRPRSSACLLSCGASFIEVQMGTDRLSEMAGLDTLPSAMARCFTDDPAFAGLPYPFVLGWDASFYPSPRDKPGLLCLICGDLLLLWDLADGKADGDAVEWRRSAVLEGLSDFPVARVVAAVNCWPTHDATQDDDRGDGSVVAFFYESSSVTSTHGLQYLEFDVSRKKVVKGPMAFVAYARARFGAVVPPSSAEKALLTVLCCPQAPCVLYLFYDTFVQVLAEKHAAVATTLPVPAENEALTVSLSDSPAFFAVPIKLPTWGRRQRHCRITLDLAALLQPLPARGGAEEGDYEGALVAGMRLISSGGERDAVAQWLVQCSQHGHLWEDVAIHNQKAGSRVVGETTWTPRASGRYSAARYWRFTRLSADASAGGASTAVAERQSSLGPLCYSQLRLMGVSRKRSLRVPVRVSGTSGDTCTTDVCRAFFTLGGLTSTVSLRRLAGEGDAAPSSVSSTSSTYELVWDYGLDVVVLSGLVFTVENTSASVRLTWTAYCGSVPDTQQWTRVASTSSTDDAMRYALSWVPSGPYRYWRLVCVATKIANHSPSPADCPTALTLSQLRVYEYGGPLVGLQSPSNVYLNATSLLWAPLTTKTAAPSNLASCVNSAVQLYRVAAALTWCKVDFLISGSCTACVAMEWSADSTAWFTVALNTFSINNVVAGKTKAVVLAWHCCGPRRLWRIRVLDTSSGVTFLPVRVYLGTSPAENSTKFISPEVPSDAGAPPQPSVATPAPSRRSSVQVVAKPSLLATSSAAAVAAAASASVAAAASEAANNITAKMTTDLFLESPQRLTGVRATLPTATSRYAVEYLGLDGVSWLTAGLLEGCADTQKQHQRMLSNTLGWVANVPQGTAGGVVASPLDSMLTTVWWDITSVSPSTHWRLRPLLNQSDLSSGIQQQQQQFQRARAVEWFADVGSTVEMVDMAEVPGVMVSTTGFTEVQPPHCLSGTNKASLSAGTSGLKEMPVLQCTVTAKRNGSLSSGVAACTATWSFITPILLDQLTLQLRATPKVTQGGDEEAADARAAASSVRSEAAIQSLWVETSDNGEDYVAVAHALWWPTDTTVTLTWEEIPPSSYWRLRVSKVSRASDAAANASRRLASYTLDVFAARWSVGRPGPALTASVRVPILGRFSNTSYRAWLTERFNHEGAFISDCQDAFDEVRSTESKLRATDALSPSAMVAAAVQKLKTTYQTFLQKAAKEAARQSRVSTEEESASSPAAAGSTAAGGEESRLASRLSSTSPHFSHLHLLSPDHASSDVLLMLLESATSPALAGEKLTQLAELVNHPLAFREAFRYTKKSARWFYPSLEAVGQLAHDWYGFSPENVYASFCVYWSLSSALQRRRDALLSTKDVILPLSEHIASPLVVVQLNEVNWSPSQRFPGAPFLYATNIHEKPTTVVFALNDVVFMPPYALGIPGSRESQALSSPYPYTVYAGVNFVQARTLDSCPAPVFDVLRYLLPPSLTCAARDAKDTKATGRGRGIGANTADTSTSSNMKSGEKGSDLILMVLTMASLQAKGGSSGNGEGATAHLRFTVPADGVTFGIRSLVIDSLEFEIEMSTEGPGRQWTYQTTFISHGARFVEQSTSHGSVATEVPVSLIGSMEMQGFPVLALRGSLGNARVASVAELPGAVMTNLSFHAIAQVDRVPTAGVSFSNADDGDGAATAVSWACGALQSEGRLTLPGVPGSCSCTCMLSVLDNKNFALHVSQVEMALQRSSLSEVQAFCRACYSSVDGVSRTRPTFAPAFQVQPSDICGMRVHLAVFLKMAAPSITRKQRKDLSPALNGTGLLFLDNCVLQGATVEVNKERETVSVTATCKHPLRFGAVVFQGTDDNPVSLQLLLSLLPPPQHRATRDATPRTLHRLLVAGSAHLFGRKHTARVSLEMTRSTDTGHTVTLVGYSLRHACLEAALQDSALSLAWRYAQVTVDEQALRQALTTELGNVPIVAALRAHGIPLTCVVASIAAAPFDLVARRLSIRVKGLLFGASFDAVTSLTHPDDVVDVWSAMVANLCPEVVEQCEENLWASYANVVGCRMGASLETPVT